MIQEDNMVPADLVVGDVSVFLSQMLEEKDGIRRTKPAERKPEQIALEAGREVVTRGPAVTLSHFVSSGRCHLVSVNLVQGSRCWKEKMDGVPTWSFFATLAGVLCVLGG
jgi:hypothetical protein